MSWTVVLLLALAAFLVGGVISFARQKRPTAAAILGVLAILSIVAAFLWAWEPT